MTRRLLSALLLGALGSVSPAALAQDAAPFSLAPAPQTVAPAPQTLAPAIAAPAVAAPVAPVAPQPVAIPGLARLPASLADLTFIGETGRRTLAVFAQPGQAAGPATLVLRLQNAISDDPQSSRLTVGVNGKPLQALQLTGGDAQMVQLAIPAGMIQPGYNAVSFTVDQAHRVDCSVGATYELWTRIDPTQSGFIYGGAGAAATADWGSVLAVVGADAGRTDIRARIAPGAPDDLRDGITRLAQAVAVAASANRPTVEYDVTPGIGPGVDLLLGTPQALQATLGSSTPPQPGVNILPPTADGRVTVAVADTLDHLDTDIASLAALASKTASFGTPAGIAAKAGSGGVPADQNRTLTLAELGVDQRVFHGRHFVQAMQFSLPSDFYPADYDKAGLGLSAYYMPGLAKGAQLLISLNGKTAATVILSGSRTGEIRQQVLPLALSSLRPGLNTLTIEAVLPATSDASCAPGHVADSTGRLQISGDSFLRLPSLARVGRFPDVAAMGDDITGAGDGSGSVDVMLAGDGAAPLNAAGTLLAKIAVEGQRVVDVHIRSAGALGTNATLVVGALDALPATLVQQLNLNVAGRIAAPSTTAATSSQPASANPFASAAANAGSSTEMGPIETVFDTGRRTLTRVRAAFRGLASSLGWDAGGLGLGGPATFVPPPGTTLLVAQRPAASSNPPTTLVAGSDPQALDAEVANLIDDPMWNKLSGSITAFDKDGAVLQTLPAISARLFPTQAFDLWNSRLVIAGWLSNNGEIYATLLILAAALVGFSTFLVLVATRKKTP